MVFWLSCDTDMGSEIFNVNYYSRERRFRLIGQFDAFNLLLTDYFWGLLGQSIFYTILCKIFIEDREKSPIWQRTELFCEYRAKSNPSII